MQSVEKTLRKSLNTSEGNRSPNALMGPSSPGNLLKGKRITKNLLFLVIMVNHSVHNLNDLLLSFCRFFFSSRLRYFTAYSLFVSRLYRI